MITDSIIQTKIEKLEEVKDYLSHSMQGKPSEGLKTRAGNFMAHWSSYLKILR
jgi:hypothetical protein